ncbi:hypothetical protein [Jannaschia sp. 2305UL9-9]|uniref:hypothetical protein n=1 Tax=Jannaschia sp. 2305UL9-9 TaxID=3121638 RepID=UPI0035275EB4
MNEPKKTYEEAMAGLYQEFENGADPKPKTPRKLKLGVLEAVPEVFQVRHGLVSMTRFGQQVGELFKRIRQGKELDFMTVWWSGERWIVIEGHHRLTAYREHARETKTPQGQYRVAVAVFKGTPKEAEKKAGDDNTKARNQMTSAEIQEWTWRLLVTGTETSPTALVDLTSVSRQQVYRMVDAIKTLKQGGMAIEEMMELGWWRCRTRSQEVPANEEDPKDGLSEAFKARREKTAKRFFAALEVEFGPTWLKQVDALAYGLATQHPQFAKMLLDSEHLWPLTQELQREAAEEDTESDAQMADIVERNSRIKDSSAF